MNLFAEFVDVVFAGVQARAAAALQVDKSFVSRLYRAKAPTVSPALAQRIELVSGGRYRRERFLWPDEASPASQGGQGHG